MTRKSTPLDIYFHMANHYRKLQSVKSVVDTSAPIGYEKLQGARQSRPPSRAEKHRECLCLDRSHDRSKFNVTKHDCLSKEPNPPTRSQSLPPRPPTRRKLSDMPTPRQGQCSSRARSSGPSSRRGSAQKSRSTRSQRSPKFTPPVFAHFTTSVKPNPTQEADHKEVNEKSPTPAPRNVKSKQRDTTYKNSITDHEYLQFSLRITEDIIRNDLYTNKEMRRVFNSHLEANRGRLDMEKMSQQIDSLCKELNIPLSETQDDALNTRPQTKSPRLAKRNNPSCICGPKSGPFGAELKDCECASTRCLPLQCIQHSINKMEKINNNGITCNTSANTIPSSQGSGKDKAEEEEIQSASDIVEIQVCENPDSVSVAPMSLSEYFLTQREGSNESDNIPYYNDFDVVAPIRQSMGFLELPLLPSLSRVTEKTEPTTSCDTMNAKSEPNTESGLEFEASDVLPVCQQLEQDDKESLTESFYKKKHIKLGEHRLMKLQPDSPLQGSEQNTEDYLISVQPDYTSLSESHHSQAKPKLTNLVQQASSSAADGENVYWFICPSNRPEQTASVAHTGLHTKEDNLRSAGIPPCTSIQSVPLSESNNMKTLSSTYYSQPTTVSFTAQQAISETRSEPITQCKMPVPAPRSYSHASAPSSEIKCVDLDVSTTESRQNTINKNIKNDGICNCDKKNCKYLTTQLLETSNIKIRGLNNQEQEYVLVSGPIYIPKSSITPVNSESSRDMPLLAPETVKRNVCTFSKDAMVNTDEQLSDRSNTNNTKNTQSSTSSKFTVIKEPSFSSNISSCNHSVISPRSTTNNSCVLKPAEESDSATYSQMHKFALNTTHFTSFASNISGMRDLFVPHSHPISESFLLSEEVQTNISKPPKVLLKCRSPSILSSGTEGNVLTQLNDYDLTPQRDSNRSAYSNNTVAESQQFSFKDQFTLFNKDALLLGDEYEIKDDFGSKKSSISSCYDNGLPHSICRFYPNISTQTRSSDFLLPTVPSAKLKKSEINQPQKPTLPKTEPINKEVDQEQQQDKKSILKKKVPLSKQPETKHIESDHPNLQDQEPVKQRKLKNEESDKQQELQTLPEDVVELSSSDSSEEKSVSFGQGVSDKEDLSGLLQVDNEEEIFDKEPEDNEMEFEDDEEEKTTDAEYRIEEKEANEGKNANEANREGEDAADKNNEENYEEEDILEELDRPPASFVHRPSMILTVKQVTNQLERFRKTEIPVDEFVQCRYNVPKKNQAFEVAEDLRLQQAESTVKQESNTSIFSTLTNSSFRGSTSRLPFIEIENSETHLEIKPENSSEIENTLCCGLKRGKKKGRRDIVNVDESSHKMPNISSIPDDQLFDMKPRRPTVDSRYGNDRKSLRFDYSAMGQYTQDTTEDERDRFRRETLDIKDFTSHYSAELSLSKVPPIESSTDMIPVLRNPVVSYRTPSSLQQPKYDNAFATSPVQSHENVATANNDGRNSVVDILPPQNESMSSIQVIESPETENI